MRLGVYGGTFNPMHAGHVHILREMIRRLSLDRVLVIPANVPPHKQAEDLADGAHRLAMCRLAAEEVREAPVEVSDLELQRTGPSYTADTLEELHRRYPEDKLFLLMGEDMFLTVEHWVRAREIMSLCTLCACPRSDSMEALRAKKRQLEAEFSARCVLEDVPYHPASSTEIRARLRAGEPLTGLAPAKVEAYIRAHGLYMGKEKP